MHRELSVPLDTTYLSTVRKAVVEIAVGARFSAQQANMIALAVDEALANIMEHAFPEIESGSAGQQIELILDANSTRFEALVRDHGTHFDPREAPEIDMQEHVKAGRKGGLGIFLMKRIMDEIHYTLKPGSHNELVMVKYVDSSKPTAKSNGPV
jgi:serine/threonine-protein kinase RsbW